MSEPIVVEIHGAGPSPGLLVPGPPGADGRETELRQGADHIEWRYAGEAEWQPLVALSDIVGPEGDPGPPGADLTTPPEVSEVLTSVGVYVWDVGAKPRLHLTLDHTGTTTVTPVNALGVGSAVLKIVKARAEAAVDLSAFLWGSGLPPVLGPDLESALTLGFIETLGVLEGRGRESLDIEDVAGLPGAIQAINQGLADKLEAGDLDGITQAINVLEARTGELESRTVGVDHPLRIASAASLGLYADVAALLAAATAAGLSEGSGYTRSDDAPAGDGLHFQNAYD